MVILCSLVSLCRTSSTHSRSTRERLTVFRSDDGGRSWPRKLLVHAGPSAYSSMLLSGGRILILYESGEAVGDFFADRIVFARLRLEEASPLGPPP